MQKDLGILMNKKLNMSQEHALTAWKDNSILGNIKRSMDCREKEGTVATALTS